MSTRSALIILALALIIFALALSINAREYRALNGYGNNVANPLAGTPNQYYLRTVVPTTFYNDTNQTMIPSPSNGTMLNCTDPLPQGYYPLARCISNIADSYRTPSSDFARRRQFKSLRKVSHMATFFGQWLSFDIASSFATAEPNNISIPKDDDVYLSDNGSGFNGLSSLPFNRSNYQGVPGKVPTPRTGINTVTSFLDASPIYSDNNETLATLRDLGNRGKMKLVNNFPPKYDNLSYILGAAPHRSANVFTNMISTILLREHNRLCDVYYAKHGDAWTDEVYFQEARRWIIALLQKITITEYLGVILGSPLSDYTGYNASLAPGIEQFFSTVTFRYGHSEPSDTYYLLDSNGEFITAIPLWHLQDPTLLENFGIETLSRSISLQRQEEVDAYYSDTMRSCLNIEGTLLDVAAVDHMRARDHGIPLYNDVRKAFGLPPAKIFADITSDGKLLTKLGTLYDNVNQVESLIGALSEDHVAGTNFGSLLEASMIKQWSDIRASDRFWYESPGLFTDDEQAELRNTTWRDVIVRNLKEETGASIPRNVWFVQPTTGLVTTGITDSSNSTAVKYPNMLKLADIYYLYWYIDGTNIRILINFQSDNGWFGIGFGSTDGGMTGADFVITTATNKSPNVTTVTVGEHLSTGYHPPEYDTKVQLIKVIRAEISNGMTTVEFMRPLLPTARGRANINNMANPFIFAYNPSSSVFTYHGGNRGFTKINFLSGKVYATAQLSGNFTKMLHGYGMFVTWGVIFPVSIFIVRYMKHILNSYMTIHRNLQIVGGVTVSSMGAAAMATVDPAQRTPHAITGLVLYTIIFLQFGLGFLSVWGQESLQSVNEGIPRAIKRIHRILGFCLLITAWFNIYLGLDTYGSPEILEVFYLVWMGLLCATFISAEVYFRFFAHKVALRMAGLDDNENRWMLKDLINREVYDNLPLFSWNDVNEKVATGALLVVAEKIVFDIREWVPVHPGGSKILERMVGTDITKDFFGDSRSKPDVGDIKKSHSATGETKSHLQASIFANYPNIMMSAKISKMKPTRKSNRLPDLAAVYDRMNSRSFNGLHLVQHQHTVFAARKLATMALARLDLKEGVYFQSDMPKHEYRRWVLIHKETVTPEGAEQPVRRFMFQIVHQTEEPVRAFLPGEYVELQSKARGQIVVRPYTPIKGDTSKFCIYVKIYSQGLMSNHMDNKLPGFELKVRGPFDNGNRVETILSPKMVRRKSSQQPTPKLNMYANRILMNVARPEDGCWKKLFMIAGGTGVSPCIQLIKHHLKFLKMASMHLLFANDSIIDVIDPLTLDHLVAESKMRLTVTYTFSKPPPNWHGLYGHVNAQMLKKWLDNVDGRDSSNVIDVGGDVNRSHSVMEQLRQEARNHHERSAEEVAVLSDRSTDDEDEEPRALDMDDEDGATPLLRWPQKEEVSKEGVPKSEGHSSIQRTLSISTKPVTSDTHLDGDVKFVVCGPIPMLDALELAFGELGIPETQLVLI